MFGFLQPHELQCARLPCPSPHPAVCSGSCPLHQFQPSQLLSPLSPCAFSLCQHQGLFQLVGWSHQVTRYWSFSFSISPSNEYSELISFRTDWFDLAVKSLLQHHSSKASVLQHSVFFIVQLSHTYMTTRKTIALPIWTFVSKVRRRQWQPTPVFLPGESHGQRSLVGYSLWGHKSRTRLSD